MRRIPALAVLLVPLALGSLAAAGTPDLKSFPASDFKDAAYHAKVHRKVGSAWVRPSESPKPGGKAVVIATVLRDGSVIEQRLHMKSGSDSWDASALAAVKKASPFEPLPKSFPRTSLEIHFHFEWNP